LEWSRGGEGGKLVMEKRSFEACWEMFGNDFGVEDY
jgi:hypothetical protein